MIPRKAKMPSPISALTHILLILTIHSTLSERSECKNKEDCTKQPQCALYLAESSIPGAGMGLYSGIPVPKNTLIGTPDIAIPILNVEDSDKLMIKRYTWQGAVFGMYSAAAMVDTFAPGAFALCNGHQGLHNTINNVEIDSDNVGVDRWDSPGSGAFTPYFKLQPLATKDVEQGQELFASYGDHWYSFENRKEKFKNVPISTDYDEADALVEKFYNFQQNEAKEINDNDMNIFWKWVRENYPDTENAYRLLPKSVSDLGHVYEIGVGKYNAPKDFTRSLEWLDENGVCVSYLKAGISSIPHAGRGAFSTKAFQKGEVVTSSPLLHECTTDYINFNIDDGSKRTQLLVNYCFSHSSSSVLLCPYSPYVNLINHSKEPNVAIRWSTSKLNNMDWLELSYQELCAKQHAGLVIDYIAVRDISEGEEIVLDYGEAWQKAWEEHVQSFQATIPFGNHLDYKSPYEYNKDPDSVILTVGEQRKYPYPQNIITECNFRDDGIIYIPKEADDIYDDEGFDKLPKRLYTGHEFGLHQLHECNVYSRYYRGDDSIPVYMVGMRLWVNDVEEEFETLVFDMPREAIRFADSRYMADYHLQNAFRCSIGMNQIFPKDWGNL